LCFLTENQHGMGDEGRRVSFCYGKREPWLFVVDHGGGGGGGGGRGGTCLHDNCTKVYFIQVKQQEVH